MFLPFTDAQKSYALIYPSEPPVNKNEEHWVEAKECTAEGEGIATIASMDIELGGDWKMGLNNPLLTKCGGCGSAKGDFPPILPRDVCEEAVDQLKPLV